MLKHLIAAAVTALLVAGCSSAIEKQQLSVAALCLTYGKSLTELAPYRPKMDATAVAVVEAVRKSLNPVCLAATPPSATEAATVAAMSGIGQLATVIAVAKGN